MLELKLVEGDLNVGPLYLWRRFECWIFWEEFWICWSFECVWGDLLETLLKEIWFCREIWIVGWEIWICWRFKFVGAWICWSLNDSLEGFEFVGAWVWRRFEFWIFEFEEIWKLNLLGGDLNLLELWICWRRFARFVGALVFFWVFYSKSIFFCVFWILLGVSPYTLN